MAVSFLNSFLSYLVVLVVIAVVGAVAITLESLCARKECSRGKETDRRIIHGKIFGTEIKTLYLSKMLRRTRMKTIQ